MIRRGAGCIWWRFCRGEVAGSVSWATRHFSSWIFGFGIEIYLPSDHRLDY